MLKKVAVCTLMDLEVALSTERMVELEQHWMNLTTENADPCAFQITSIPTFSSIKEMTFSLLE